MKTAKVKTPGKADSFTKKPKVKMISYAIEMIIPTGRYADIRPKIVVTAGSPEEAHDYIAPHMNRLWKDYYLISERRPEHPNPLAKVPVTPVIEKEVAPTSTVETVVNQPPASSVALAKATQAIQSCLSLEAFELIANQVEVSTKLTNEDKVILMPILSEKFEELSAKD